MLTQRILLKLIRTLIQPHAGKKEYQSMFERIHDLSLEGMAMGSGAYTEASSEKQAIAFVKQQLGAQSPFICLDVGANTGQFTTLLHEVMGKDAIIHSFEPSPATFKRLQENTRSFSGVHLHPMGLGDAPGKLNLFTNQDESLIASVYQRRLDHFGIVMDKQEQVDITTLDAFCAEHKLDRIHFLKMDVEGHELNVLKGATEMLHAGKINFIQFEFGGCNIDSRTYFQDFFYLLSEKYTLYRIVQDGLFPVRGYKETLEVFVTTNYLACLK